MLLLQLADLRPQVHQRLEILNAYEIEEAGKSQSTNGG
jgi:hypothetical protein